MPAMRLARLQSLPLLSLGVLYTCAHMVLDWLSYVHPFGAFGLTPWNPSTGFGFVLVLVMGRRMLPVFCSALVVSNLTIRGMPVPFWAAGVESVIVGTGYGLALITLLHPSLRFDPSLSSVRDLFLLLVVSAVSGAVVSSAYVSFLVVTDLLPAQEWSIALLRYWVGDMIGIAVVTPFGLVVSTRDRLIKVDWESALQIGSTLSLTVWVVAVFAEHHQLQLFYLLFLPVSWIAVRSGIEGVSVALMSIQLGLVVAIVIFPTRAIDVLDFQARMLILSVTGLVAGALVSERRLAEIRLRMNQDALAQVSRLGSMGELAAAIAHEINQPLSAAGTYTGLVAESLEGERLRDQSTLGLAKKAAVQIDRAADVVRRLRTLFRLGRSDLVPTNVAIIVGETVDLAGTDLERQGIALKLEVASDLPLVMADRLQIEQVLLNLIRNSMDAMTPKKTGSAQITISARRAGPQFMELTVSDTGPGFPSGFVHEPPFPLTTTKAEGLGIGLALCRSIVEAHGGTLSIRSDRDGARVSVLLPIPEDFGHG